MAAQKKEQADVVKETHFDISDADVQSAADKLSDTDLGYVTKKDYPQMDDEQWARAFYSKIAEEFTNREDDNYLYVEPFDYVGGDIDMIIFNMDIVKTREDARKDLAKALGEKA
ncbi:hypothetical protein IV38_GL000456 [Lactobacillus selangorensis]|uniref:Uncharacterized protein n=1 Tax=Lactobacillus selangorensis TaxID=81857 RepID=A0A0R2FLX6_9LACO|nr:hypothetical protein [Lactobacillus selangorensis]KRN29570.1 hypothetical protein IV38_GL000456 [Lactobacillus selangorensis]KRN33900.1 hypothetical protein IV40_GL000212 [Lactobacillus selangorensis]